MILPSTQSSALYLIDANVFIALAGGFQRRGYYAFGRIDPFWEWICHLADSGVVKIPRQNWHELVPSNDDRQDELCLWAKKNKDLLMLKPDCSMSSMEKVKNAYQGEGSPIGEREMSIIGRDAFLVASALSNTVPTCVVTDEVSKPSKKKAKNKKIPDICHQLEIRCINSRDFICEIDFKLDWERITV